MPSLRGPFGIAIPFGVEKLKWCGEGGKSLRICLAISTIPACDRQTCDSIVHAMHSITRNPEIPDKITTVVFTLAV